MSEKVSQHKYSLLTDNGFTYIAKDGSATMCPFQNKLAIPQENKFGGGLAMAINQYPCNPSCVHCNISKNEGAELAYVEITCSGTTLAYKLEEEIEITSTTPNGGGTILTM